MLEVGVSGKGGLDGLGVAVVNGSKGSVGDVGLGVVVLSVRVGVAGDRVGNCDDRTFGMGESGECVGGAVVVAAES